MLSTQESCSQLGICIQVYVVVSDSEKKLGRKDRLCFAKVKGKWLGIPSHQCCLRKNVSTCSKKYSTKFLLAKRSGVRGGIQELPKRPFSESFKWRI